MSSDALAADRLYANLVLLEGLADYAIDPRASVPPTLPGLNDEEQEFLKSPDGAGAAASWLRAFHSTLILLRDFRAADLAGQLTYDDQRAEEKDLRDALNASNTALKAAVSRVSFLAGRASPEPHSGTKTA